MEALLELLEERRARRLLTFTEPTCGLRAFLVLDDLSRGPAAGGIRTRAYPTPYDAVRDACDLSRAMTYKCAIADLDAGGAKMVILDRPGLDREAAFRFLGARVDELGGQFLTAGDLGTTHADLEVMATQTRYVRTDDLELGASVGRSVRVCAEALAAGRGHASLAGLRVAIQGCGAMGSAVAESLAAAGAELFLADLDEDAARRTAERVGGTAIDAHGLLAAEVDIVAPCAAGGVIDAAAARQVRAWGVCGAANNILADAAAAERLAERDITFVPDVISSAGAVIAGVCDFQDRDDAEAVIDALGPTTREVLEEAQRRGATPTAVAIERAARRLMAADEA